MKIRAIVEFVLSDEELTQEFEGEDGEPDYTEVVEPDVDKFIGQDIQLKSGEYENLYMGTIVSAEEIAE